jgi:mRNA interferase MazF
VQQLPVPERGDLYRASLRGYGHELTGPHYVVVVSDEPYNWISTVVVVPFSSSATSLDWRPEATLRGARTRALVDQVQVIDKRLLREHLGSLAGTAVLDQIDQELQHLLGFGD